MSAKSSARAHSEAPVSSFPAIKTSTQLLLLKTIHNTVSFLSNYKWKLAHHLGVRKLSAKVTDLRASRNLHHGLFPVLCPLGILLTARWKKHLLLHRAQGLPALPLYIQIFYCSHFHQEYQMLPAMTLRRI